MTSYADISLKMHRLLRGQESPESLAGFFGSDPRRLSIYPRFVRNHVLTFLDSNFSALQASLPETAWKKLCLEYFEKHPTTDWRLWTLASAFTAFIRGREGGEGLHPWHTELALLEWSEIEAYHHPAPIPRPVDLKVPTLNPTLVALRLKYPVLPWIQSLRSSSGLKTTMPDLANPLDEEQVVFVFLHPESLGVAHIPASENLLFAFKVAHDGIPLEKASRVAGQDRENVETALRNAEKSGILILPEHWNPRTAT